MSHMNPGDETIDRTGPAFIRDPLVILRRAGLWTLLCSISATPSFVWAAHEFSRAAMVTGVAAFILFYTAATSTQAFHLFSRRPFVRRTLYIGYGLRVGVSIIFPLGMILDLLPGIISVNITEEVFRKDHSFVPTLITTLIQGTILNAILSIFMCIVYGLQRAFLKPPPDREGLCEKCGYDLRASYEFGRCPECGTPCLKPAGLAYDEPKA